MGALLTIRIPKNQISQTDGDMVLQLDSDTVADWFDYVVSWLETKSQETADAHLARTAMKAFFATYLIPSLQKAVDTGVLPGIERPDLRSKASREDLFHYGFQVMQDVLRLLLQDYEFIGLWYNEGGHIALGGVVPTTALLAPPQAGTSADHDTGTGESDPALSVGDETGRDSHHDSGPLADSGNIGQRQDDVQQASA